MQKLVQNAEASEETKEAAIEGFSCSTKRKRTTEQKIRERREKGIRLYAMKKKEKREGRLTHLTEKKKERDRDQHIEKKGIDKHIEKKSATEYQAKEVRYSIILCNQ